MSKKLFVFFSCLHVMAAMAQLPQSDSPMVTALIEGQATSSLPNNPQNLQVIQALQKSTKNDGDILVVFKRITRFKEQNTCGRITMYVAQPASKTTWAQMGGDLNICEDGLPPLKVCAESPKKLVAPDANCKGGRSPIDTPEIKAAIANSLKHGSMTAEQAQAKMKSEAKSMGSAK